MFFLCREAWLPMELRWVGLPCSCATNHACHRWHPSFKQQTAHYWHFIWLVVQTSVVTVYQWYQGRVKISNCQIPSAAKDLCRENAGTELWNLSKAAVTLASLQFNPTVDYDSCHQIGNNYFSGNWKSGAYEVFSVNKYIYSSCTSTMECKKSDKLCGHFQSY